MQKRLFRKGLAFGIIVLFIGASAVPSISRNARESSDVVNVFESENVESNQINKPSTTGDRSQTYSTDFEDGTVGQEYSSDWLNTAGSGTTYITNISSHSGSKSYYARDSTATFWYTYPGDENMTSAEMWIKVGSSGITCLWQDGSTYVFFTIIDSSKLTVYTYDWQYFDLYFDNPGSGWHRFGWTFNTVDNVTYWVDDPVSGNQSFGSPHSGSIQRIDRMVLGTGSSSAYVDDHGIVVGGELDDNPDPPEGYLTYFEDGVVGSQYSSDWLVTTSSPSSNAYVTDYDAFSGRKSYYARDVSSTFWYTYPDDENMTSAELWVKTSGTAVCLWQEGATYIVYILIYSWGLTVYTFDYGYFDLYFDDPGSGWHRFGWTFNTVDNVTYWVDDPVSGNQSFGSPFSGSIQRIDRLVFYPGSGGTYVDDHSITVGYYFPPNVEITTCKAYYPFAESTSFLSGENILIKTNLISTLGSIIRAATEITVTLDDVELQLAYPFNPLQPFWLVYQIPEDTTTGNHGLKMFAVTSLGISYGIKNIYVTSETADSDNDGLLDIQEDLNQDGTVDYVHETDPFNPDTDNDGFNDSADPFPYLYAPNRKAFVVGVTEYSPIVEGLDLLLRQF